MARCVQPGVPALAIDQPAEGLDVLRARAEELGASSFTVVPENPDLYSITLGTLPSFILPSLANPNPTSGKSGLAGAHQRTNASLSLALVQTFLSSPRLPPAYSSSSLPSSTSNPLPRSLIAPSPLSPILIKGLEQTRWPGRCQIEDDHTTEGVRWYLDGAHTIESLKCCGDWFGEVALSKFVLLTFPLSPPLLSSRSLSTVQLNDSCSTINRKDHKTRYLIFNCTSGRSGASLLGTLLAALSTHSSHPFQHVVFCTNTTFSSGASKGGTFLLFSLPHPSLSPSSRCVRARLRTHLYPTRSFVRRPLFLRHRSLRSLKPNNSTRTIRRLERFDFHFPPYRSCKSSYPPFY